MPEIIEIRPNAIFMKAGKMRAILSGSDLLHIRMYSDDQGGTFLHTPTYVYQIIGYNADELYESIRKKIFGRSLLEKLIESDYFIYFVIGSSVGIAFAFGCFQAKIEEKTPKNAKLSFADEDEVFKFAKNECFESAKKIGKIMAHGFKYALPVPVFIGIAYLLCKNR